MPQWQVLRIQHKVFIIGLWSDYFAGVRRQITVHIPWIVPIVPWGPSSLLAVPLTSVNDFHYWLVIRRCSCMFDFSSLIHMLGLVLYSSRDGAQDPGFCLIKSSLRILCGLSRLVTWLIWLDGCDHTWVYLLTLLTGCLRPYLGSWLLYTLLWMAAPIPHIMYQRY